MNREGGGGDMRTEMGGEEHGVLGSGRIDGGKKGVGRREVGRRRKLKAG